MKRLTKKQYSLLVGAFYLIVPPVLWLLPLYFVPPPSEDLKGITTNLFSFLSEGGPSTLSGLLLGFGSAMLLVGALRVLSILFVRKSEIRDKIAFWTYIAYIFLSVAYGISCYYYQSSYAFLVSILPAGIPLILLFVEGSLYSAED